MNKEYKKGAAYSSVLSVLAKAVAFAQQLCIAYFCGVNATTDIYFYLINLAFLIGGMIQIITSSIVIPQSMDLRLNSSLLSEMRYLNSFLFCILIIGCSLIFILGLYGVGLMQLITKFSVMEINTNIVNFYLFLPVTLLLVVNSVFAEIMVSYKYFTAPIWLNLNLNLSIIITVFFLQTLFGGFSMMIGALFVSFLNCIIFVLYFKRKFHWEFMVFDFKLLFSSSKSIGGLFLNQSVVIFISMFPFYLLSQYQVGSITLVNYAMKLVQAPYAFLQQISIVMQVKLNELNAKSRDEELRNITKKVAYYIFIIGAIIAFVIFVLRNPIVNIFYGLGNLSDKSLLEIINIIAITIIALPFIGFGQAWAKLYFAKKQIKLYIYTMLFINIISYVIYYFFIFNYQIIGYAIAYVIVEILIALGLWYRIQAKLFK